MSLRRRTWLPWAWTATTALLIAGVIAIAWAQAQSARARWQAEVRVASLRPQQFFQNWLELRRQLLRSLVLRSRGEGWRDVLQFEMDVSAVRGDIDGEIALPVIVARVLNDGSLSPIAQHEIQPGDWAELRQRGLPHGLREAFQAPLSDGRVPLAQPVGGDQWVWLLLEVPELFRQLRSLDWPPGLALSLELIDSEGLAHPVWRSAEPVEASFAFELIEEGPAGRWRLRWSATGGPEHFLLIMTATLASICLLALSLGGWLLLQRGRQLRLSLAQQQVLHAELRQGLEARAAALQASLSRQQQDLQGLTALQREIALAALAKQVGSSAPPPALATPRRERFALRTLLETLLGEIAPRLRALSCLIDYRPGEALQMESYPSLLLDLLRLCIDRAVIQGLAAHPAPALALSYAALPGGRVCIELRDNGQTLEADAMARFFAPPGCGDTPWLGGYLLQLLLADPLGGQCRLRIDAQEGNLLQIELPLVAPDQASGQA